ncbi:hypothetical protein [Nocardioides sp.]|uniref:hypothetical protein n=1 Tax=Nocardioides sp. TaxID=35761 RepID=UPI002625320D|nr:hypothetical protein [Nocardioides sp.]
MRRSPVLGSALLLLSLAVGCGDRDAAPRTPTAGTSGAGWVRLPDPPLSGRVGATLVPLDADRVLVLGGWEWLCPPGADCSYPDTPQLRDGAVVDLRSGEWTAVPDAPIGLFHAPAVVSDGSVLVLGARTWRDDPELLVLDVDAGRWERRAAPRGVCSRLVPTPTGLVATCGTDENGESPDRAYDLATDTWTELPDDPLPPVFDRFAVLDGKRLLVLGSLISEVGDDDARTGKVVAALDLATGRWERLPDAPGDGYQAWGVGDEVWVNPHFGPEGGGVLSLDTGRWRPLPDLPADPDLPEHMQGDLAGVVGDGTARYEYDHGWVRDTVADAWVEVPGRGSTAYDVGVVAAGEALVVFGGQDWGVPERDAASSGEGELVAETWVWRPSR